MSEGDVSHVKGFDLSHGQHMLDVDLSHKENMGDGELSGVKDLNLSHGQLETEVSHV